MRLEQELAKSIKSIHGVIQHLISEDGNFAWCHVCISDKYRTNEVRHDNRPVVQYFEFNGKDGLSIWITDVEARTFVSAKSGQDAEIAVNRVLGGYILRHGLYR
jgi:hypothetical protein